MYQFSRSIYRELAREVVDSPGSRAAMNRERFLRACESAVERLANDRHYFARPARTLFNDVRIYFPMARQMRVLRVVEHYMGLAAEYVDERAQAGVTFDGNPLSCRATTRRGTACQRVPLPGRQYCPSHQHLEEALDSAASDLEATAA